MKFEKSCLLLQELKKEIVDGDDVTRGGVEHGIRRSPHHGRRLNGMFEEFPSDEDIWSRVA